MNAAPHYILLVGAPGAGKGTQATGLAAALGLGHVASGDLFRENLANGTELGKLAKSYMDQGELVPDDVTIRMVLDRLSRPDLAAGAVLDGFPRTVAQAEALDEALGAIGATIDRVIYIEVANEELLRRLGGRWICITCQAPFGHTDQGRGVTGHCPRQDAQARSAAPGIEPIRPCGQQLYQRPDDSVETARKRLDVYFAQTAPLIDYYRNQGKLATVNGQAPIGEVAAALLEAVRA